MNCALANLECVTTASLHLLTAKVRGDDPVGAGGRRLYNELSRIQLANLIPVR
jgi:hypothetical protein